MIGIHVHYHELLNFSNFVNTFYDVRFGSYLRKFTIRSSVFMYIQ